MPQTCPVASPRDERCATAAPLDRDDRGSSAVRVALRECFAGPDACGLVTWIRETLGLPAAAALQSAQMARTTAGKPYFPQHPQVRFNLSDSGDWQALAVSETTDVGIDIERLRTVPRAGAIARRFAEPDWLPSGEPERSAVFLREWTIREALVKATGDGFSGVVRLKEVDSPEGGLRGFIDSSGVLWTARHIDAPVGSGLVCAVAGRGIVEVAAVDGRRAPKVNMRAQVRGTDGVRRAEKAPSQPDVGHCGASGCS